MALLVAGYLGVWTAFAVVVHAADLGLHRTVDSVGWLDVHAWIVSAATILLVGVYQFTPLKYRCLDKCRSPLSFIMEHWRPGRTGALQIGLRHGAWCVGCCWALMAALFALGVMSIGWMAFIAALIAAEKLLPWRVATSRGIALLLLVLGLSVAITPASVPGLTLPDSPEAMKAMSSMSGGSMEGASMNDKAMNSKQGGMSNQGMQGRQNAGKGEMK